VNDGLAKATGDYVAVYHADDVYDPRIVEREVALLEAHPQVGAVFCEDIFIDPRGRELGRLELPAEVRGGQPLDYATVLNALLTYKNRFLRGPSGMVRRSVYEEVGPYRGELFGIASDLDMWLRIARRHQLCVVEEYLFRYRRGHGSLSDGYYKLRTEPERYFGIMDEQLAQGGSLLAEPAALKAFEAYRAEDNLMRAVAHYILNQPAAARAVLAEVRLGQIIVSGRVQRGRLMVLFLMLQALTRLPRLTLIADLFYRRWHMNGRL
jgi:cellulose synthase/poly-beta-1,6-N-acetylglucosamine synthase-like glycosyltransferase